MCVRKADGSCGRLFTRSLHKDLSFFSDRSCVFSLRKEATKKNEKKNVLDFAGPWLPAFPLPLCPGLLQGRTGEEQNCLKYSGLLVILRGNLGGSQGLSLSSSWSRGHRGMLVTSRLSHSAMLLIQPRPACPGTALSMEGQVLLHQLAAQPMPTGQSDGGSSLLELFCSQVCLGLHLTKPMSLSVLLCHLDLSPSCHRPINSED